eukprot:scaffold36095_cov59-Phaeocystis_antarctica.AAC.2
MLRYLLNVPNVDLYELAHVPCSGITRRLCGWLGASGTQDLRALRLWQSSRQSGALCRVELHDCCASLHLQRRSSVNVLTAWPGRVAQAPRALAP